ncbi:gametogenetin-like [Mustela putorius furo]|uniref:Gametogenetin-like n=1 Tax=Mustela putorius furo TaxID=9669 RepID=A0A8U0V2Z8_MUSPF|nr:gametogenetin-like [Mustela putorius furo]
MQRAGPDKGDGGAIGRQTTVFLHLLPGPGEEAEGDLEGIAPSPCPAPAPPTEHPCEAPGAQKFLGLGRGALFLLRRGRGAHPLRRPGSPPPSGTLPGTAPRTRSLGTQEGTATWPDAARPGTGQFRGSRAVGASRLRRPRLGSASSLPGSPSAPPHPPTGPSLQARTSPLGKPINFLFTVPATGKPL